MSASERKRLEVFSRVAEGEMSLAEPRDTLALSYRHVKRVWKRYQDQGDVGLIHQARGRASNRQPNDKTKKRVLLLYQEQYADYGPTLAAECLAKEDGVVVATSTLRRWLVQAGLWQRKRKRKVHRRRRDRRQRFGELAQLDGSHHDWFEGRRQSANDHVAYAGWAVLMVMVDDATGRVFARFYENESWHSAADVFARYAAVYGLPRAIYVDQHSIYRPDREPTSEEILADRKPETQFGRAMRELDVELILARSPQAKGRVERMNSTLQDRLVKALRRAKIRDLKAANQFLEDTFLPEFNEQFVVQPSAPNDWHREVKGELEIDRRLAIQETRVVQKDWTIRWCNQIMQLACEEPQCVQPGQRVTLCEQLDGRLRVFTDDIELGWTEARPDRLRRQTKAKPNRGPTGSSQGQKPRKDHPWRRSLK